MRSLALTLLLICGCALVAAANSIDFENLSAGSIVNNQYASLGVIFSGGGTILTAGINLNEFDFPPHSGVNVLGDTAGPITITFTHGVSFVSAFFTYSSLLTMTAYGTHGQLLGQVTSLFSSNYTSSGNGSPNELIKFMSAAGIAKVTISGSSSGSSFAMDDLMFGKTTTPEPSSALLLLTGLAGVAKLKRRRGVKVGKSGK